MEITGVPSNGGLNLDDDLENLPKDDYESADNLMVSLGDKSFSKLYGTESIHSITGSCFGIFDFAEYTVLFIDNGSGTGNQSHEIYLIKEDDTKELIFKHELDIDTSIQLISCKLLNNEMLIFNNAVNEVMKIHIGMGRLSAGYDPSGDYNNAEFILGDLGWDGNSYYIENTSAPFSSNTTSIYIVLLDGEYFQDYSIISNNVLEGYSNDSGTRFTVTNELPDPTAIFLNTQVLFLETTNNFIGYRKASKDDYYLINTPPLDPPTLEYVSDGTKTQNKLKNNTFQFLANYVYWDNTESTLSPISKILVDDSFGFLEYNQNNGILVSVPHPEKYNRGNVKEVVFYVRINEGAIYEFDRKPTIVGDYNFFATDTAQDIKTAFFNDEVLLNVSELKSNSQFDWIGDKVGDIEIIDDTTLALADNNLPRFDVNPITSLNYTKKDAVVEQSEDWVFAYRYDYGVYNTDTDVQAGTNTYYSTGTQKYPVPFTLTPSYWQVKNLNAKGESIDPINSATTVAELAETVTKSTAISARNKEFGTNKAYVYFDFSDTQEVGTVYNVEIKLFRRHPSTGNLEAIKSAARDFLATTTTTKDLLDNIKDWVDNKSGLNDFNYGTDKVETEAHIGADTFNNEFAGTATTISPRSDDSLQIFSGFQCSHNDPSHYHWYQVDQLEVNITKISATNYIKRTFKNQAEHRFGLRYRDKFGRVLSNVKTGSIDLTGEADLNTYYEGELRINHLAPQKAAKCDILYAGNKNYNGFIYAVVSSAGTPSGGGVELEFDFDTYNNDYGVSLGYTFTKGDVIQRLASKSGSTYTEITDKKAYRIIGQDGVSVKVEYDASNVFAVNDLVVIHTPKLEVDEENTLYYESGISLDVENRAHKSPDGDQLLNQAINAAVRLEEGDLFYSNSGQIIAYFQVPDTQTGLSQTTQIQFLNTKFKGTYQIQQYFPNFDTGVDLIQVSFITQSLSDLDPIPFDEDYLYITWDGATETTYNNVYQKEAYVKLIDFGDTYLKWRDSVYDHLVESYSVSDLFDSEFWGKGRPVIIGENETINSGGIVQYSQPYFNNTNLNGISTFHARDYQEYSTVNGKIKRIMEFGENLLLLKERELSRALIGKDEIQTGQGETIQTTAAIVLSPNEAQFIYTGGIGDQVYSLIKFNNIAYLADPNTKAFLRIAQNGVTPISEFKLDSYFDELFNDSSVQVYSTFNRQNYELILHIKSDSDNKQLVWNERKNRWTSFWDVDCERMIYDNRLLSFDSNALHKHTSSNRNSIYGSQVTSKLKKTFNLKDRDKNTFKSWMSIMFDPLFLDSDTKVIITNEAGQESELIYDDFIQDGSGFWAEFLRDKSTPNLGGEIPLLNGDVLQSKTITVEVSSADQGDKKLNIIAIDFLDVENRSNN